MKKLEKLESFKLKNEKLNTVLGGSVGSALAMFVASEPTATGAGEVELPSGPGGACECVSYSSDLDFHNGGIGYNRIGVNGKPCNP